LYCERFVHGLHFGECGIRTSAGCCDWQLRNGQFHFFEHPVNLKEEQALEGKYIIQSEEKKLSAIEAVEVHEELSEVERAFSGLKDVIEMRPIYHRRDHRMEAHIIRHRNALALSL
jgi:transposase